MKNFARFVVLGLLFGCAQKTIENPTDDFLPAEKLATVKGKALEEVSGVASSLNNPGFLWAHNDSGNGPKVFLVNADLDIKLTCKLKGVKNRDWEDITVGPGPDSSKTYVYVAEIGDNDAKFALKYIYRFEEPKAEAGVTDMVITDFDTITFQLPDERKDTETLLLDPATKDLFVVSKREEPVWVYQLKYPQSTRDTITAAKIVSLPLTQIVGGDFSVDGKKLLLKNYEHIYYWSRTDQKPIGEWLKGKPFEVPYEIEPQGEAITWATDQSGFYTVSEKNAGKDSYLYFYKAKKAK